LNKEMPKTKKGGTEADIFKKEKVYSNVSSIHFTYREAVQ